MNAESFSEYLSTNSDQISVVEIEDTLLNLYLEWGLSSSCINALSECSINSVEILRMMQAQDINEVFNKRQLLADKIKFRFFLQKWRSENNYIPLSCCTVSDSVGSQQSTQSCFSGLDLSIEDILMKTVAGEDILTIYKFKNTLEESDQASIVRIIIDYFSFNDVKMDSKMMSKIAEVIVKLFPTENVLTYYVPRGPKRNPSGKIYDRYFNTKYKRKVSASSKNHKDDSEPFTVSSKETVLDTRNSSTTTFLKTLKHPGRRLQFLE